MRAVTGYTEAARFPTAPRAHGPPEARGNRREKRARGVSRTRQISCSCAAVAESAPPGLGARRSPCPGRRWACREGSSPALREGRGTTKGGAAIAGAHPPDGPAAPVVLAKNGHPG